MRRGRSGAAAVLVVWLVLSGVVPALAPRPASIQDNRTVNNPPASAESLRAQQILRAEFPDLRGVPALIVVARPGGRLSAGDIAAVHAMTTRLSGPGVEQQLLERGRPGHRWGRPTFDDRMISPDRSTATIVVPVLADAGDPGFPDEITAIRAAIGGVERPAGLRVAVSGPAGIVADTVAVFSRGNLVVLLGALALVLVILLIVYRAPLLAAIPLAAAGIAVSLTNATGALLAKAGVLSVNSQAASIMSVLVIGLGTDYCVFIISRYTEQLGGAH